MSGSSDSSHDTTVKDITEDEQFLRIRRLNDNNHGKRKSLHEEQLEDAVLDELGSPDVLFNTVQPNDTVIFKTRTTSEQGDKHLHVFMQKLKVKEKNRYKKDTNEMQSMTRDVDWGSRGSIMDEMVNNPLRSHFNGPAIDEKYSRVKATARSNTVRIDDNNTIEIANETIATDFSGFYVLFWMAVAFTICKVTLQYYEEHGDFSQSIILRYMTMNLWKVALYDIAMYLTSYFAFVIQYLCRKNVISWRRTGRDIISVYEVVFLFSNIYLPKKTFHFNWIAQIFLFLHSLVYLMKIHSYSFYNGYLWDISSELDYATSTLKKLKKLSSPQPELDILQKSIDFCEFEIRSQSSTVRFPFNVSVKNFFEFSSFPTLVYQIEYPRTKRIRWFYVFEKCCAIFGIIFVMMVVAQQFMLPVILKAKILADANLTLWEKNLVWPKLLLDLAPGFIMMFLLVWYLIWDAILNCVAELSCFADHHFYSDWWNCCSWYDFSRLWNRPVHSFLLRHVYHSSISAYHMSKVQATLFTFLLSSVFHELAMFVLFNKFRGYIIILQMSQIPFTALSNIPLLRDKKLFNNVTFWIGICLGPSMTGLLYLIF
ncbi:sterol acyltransferase [Kluyveromyces lactis]|uniref:O-acyltransferase n=2 Tax=Kluyveromyces lactis TaxID=28985 RepID=Q6CTY2_KLULA|nr:uncharacterized protein KLLA0_C09152g [Kluyveromyces lactis]BAG12765.1 sterol acyltransferase [Kluyveromyces lactis]BAG12766.1 sterol acyltransferase [Kluyveromyces lactis]CAH01458.1 KLLA0C09152p [Kluyveromyces lactis]|eukprot:XP_452607.1 uncharacterized protein KLLA0_C09152g [Kluyveromyces lactis]